jgi:acyl-CoA-binding protein
MKSAARMCRHEIIKFSSQHRTPKIKTKQQTSMSGSGDQSRLNRAITYAAVALLGVTAVVSLVSATNLVNRFLSSSSSSSSSHTSSTSSSSTSTSSSQQQQQQSVLSAAASDFELAVIYMRERVSSSKSQVKTAFGTLTTHEKLQLYGLYKQGSIREGGNEEDSFKSGTVLLDPISNAKHQAWKAARTLSPPEARSRYVEMINQLFPNWKKDLVEKVPISNNLMKDGKRKDEMTRNVNTTSLNSTLLKKENVNQKEADHEDIDKLEEEEEEEEKSSSHGDNMRRGYSSVPVYEETPIGDRETTDIFYIASIGNTDAAKSLLLQTRLNIEKNINDRSVLSLSTIQTKNNSVVDDIVVDDEIVVVDDGDNNGNNNKQEITTFCKVLTQVNDFGESLLHVAADAGHLSMCELLINECFIAGGETFVKNVIDIQEIESLQTALHYAYSQGRVDICKLLIEKGANSTICDINGKKAIELG